MAQRAKNAGEVRIAVTVQPYSDDPENYSYRVSVGTNVKMDYHTGWRCTTSSHYESSLVDALDFARQVQVENYPDREVKVRLIRNPYIVFGGRVEEGR